MIRLNNKNIKIEIFNQDIAKKFLKLNKKLFSKLYKSTNTS
jgi:hypothetical protein